MVIISEGKYKKNILCKIGLHKMKTICEADIEILDVSNSLVQCAKYFMKHKKRTWPIPAILKECSWCYLMIKEEK